VKPARRNKDGMGLPDLAQRRGRSAGRYRDYAHCDADRAPVAAYPVRDGDNLARRERF
jgi:hypothetical protein